MTDDDWAGWPGRGLPQVRVASADALWDWLARHYAQDDGIWLATPLKGHPEGFIARDAVLDALVAWGWTDGVRKSRDDGWTMQLIAPRRQQAWARSYQDRAARLMAEGRMQAPGQAAIDRARAAGTWDRLAHVDDLIVPDDLAAALAEARGAEWFAAAAPSYRRNALRHLAIAKGADTRARRLASIAAACAAGRKLPNL